MFDVLGKKHHVAAFVIIDAILNIMAIYRTFGALPLTTRRLSSYEPYGEHVFDSAHALHYTKVLKNDCQAFFFLAFYPCDC